MYNTGWGGRRMDAREDGWMDGWIWSCHSVPTDTDRFVCYYFVLIQYYYYWCVRRVKSRSTAGTVVALFGRSISDGRDSSTVELPKINHCVAGIPCNHLNLCVILSRSWDCPSVCTFLFLFLLSLFTGVHSNQDQILCVKVGLYMGFWIHRGFWLIWPPVNRSVFGWVVKPKL